MHSSPFATPKQLREKWPLTTFQQRFIDDARKEVHEILTFQDPRLLLIVGPCSIHDLKGAQEYARRLKALSSEVSDSFLLIMRAYFEKPRTALGWKGLVHDPFLDGSHRMDRGYELAREFLLFLATLELPAACEFLDPSSFVYNGDLISWGCIGARTSSSQVHRQMASDLSMPVAFKNSTDGNIESAVNGCLTASYPHAFLGLNEDGVLSIRHSKGNPDTHVVLRGGDDKPNYDQESIRRTLQLLRCAGLPERVVIDCSHDNCDKDHEQQQLVFAKVMQHMLSGESAIRGLMLESYLKAGNQPLSGALHRLHFGVSVTDPCLSWQATEDLILAAHQEVGNYFKQSALFSSLP
jgi:3-deoxy-7-phosphoheptulonate synthase